MIRSLYFWVMLLIGLGLVFGVLFPAHAMALKWVGDAFVSGMKILVAPLIFTSISLGIAGARSKTHLARTGVKALLYFEAVSTLALLVGLFVGNVFQPGRGFPFDPKQLSPGLVEGYLSARGHWWNPFEVGFSLIQVLVVAIVFGVSLHLVTDSRRSRIHRALTFAAETLFFLISKYMWLAPIGAGAAMAFTVGKFGLEALRPLLYFMACFYFTCALFIFGVLGMISRRMGIPILQFLNYIRSEILLVLGTSSSESALAPLMKRLEHLGCAPDVVGLVVPTGFSFNLDGTNIYLTLAVLFIAQAFGVNLSLTEQLSVLGVAMISSKGASGVTGAGFITLAATLSIVPELPVTGLVMILGVDRFMSEARAITNMIGNGVATLFISDWEGALDRSVLARALREGPERDGD